MSRQMAFSFMTCLFFFADVDQLSAEDVATADLAFFESKIRPVLVEHCHKCHGPTKQWAGLRLDSREAILKGGDHGPAIVPERPDASVLIRAVRHVDDKLKMPENGKLAESEIAALSRWIERGAVYPESSNRGVRELDSGHWAFQPITRPSIPAVKNPDWPQSPIDHFILTQLEQEQIPPAERADKRTLIRRVTFDLTGLPPTNAEIDDFLNDDQAAAFERVVDRFLESPAYGEHWGRHWLDVARYADSNGLDENIAHGNAWRYRDYVVTSINQDKPFDRFTLEQLAGDQLTFDSETQQHAQLIATGFLSIGPKVLAEVDQPKMRMDIVDEQIDAVGRVFVGLTLGCARCHDHKFDPISTADYYGLAGIFKSTRTMDSYIKVAKWHEHLLPSAAASAIQTAFEADVKVRKEAIEAIVVAADKRVRQGLAADATIPEKLDNIYPEDVKAELTKLREQLAAMEKTGPDLPAAMGVTDDEVVDVAIHLRGDTQKLGDLVPRHTPSVISGPLEQQFLPKKSGRLQLAKWLVDPKHPLTARVFVNRVWRWRFGSGLVRTTDNFGLLGASPSHPELLDWLAHRFIADGWSVKSLHRLMLNSSTYQQTSIPHPLTFEHDPENRLLGWFPRRRLAAEEVRDALLSVSDQIDRMLYGSELKVKNRGYLFDHTSIDLTDYHSSRRSLYLPVIRNHVFDFFQLLDFPDPAVPTGDRASSTVAPQALLMLNSDFVIQSADKLAERLLSEPGTASQRLATLVRTTHCREPSSEELLSHAQFIARVEQSLAASEPDPVKRTRQAWVVLCHTLLATNEFIYVK